MSHKPFYTRHFHLETFLTLMDEYYLRKNGSNKMTGDLDVNDNNLLNVLTPLDVYVSGITAALRAIETDSSIVNLMMYNEATDTIVFGGGGKKMTFANRLNQSLLPYATESFDLGAMVLQWRDIRFSRDIYVNGSVGVSGSFTTVDGKTVTVTKGLITSIV